MDVKHVTSLLAEHPEGTFLELAAFNDGGFGTCRITGVSPVWEMHPDTDEFFYVIEGELEMTLLSGEAPEHHVAGPGTSFVVPKGIWHRPGAPGGVAFIHYTPGESLHSDADDPREGP